MAKSALQITRFLTFYTARLAAHDNSTTTSRDDENTLKDVTIKFPI